MKLRPRLDKDARSQRKRTRTFQDDSDADNQQPPRQTARRDTNSVTPVSPDQSHTLLDFVESLLAKDYATLMERKRDSKKREEVAEFAEAYQLKAEIVEKWHFAATSYGQVVAAKREELNRIKSLLEKTNLKLDREASSEEKRDKANG